MIPYKKQYTFKIENSTTLKTRLNHYFKQYDFLFEEVAENQFIYFKKFSFLDGWKMNPLSWESKVVITIKNNTLSIDYYNEGNAQITPFAFDYLFSEFFKNLELYINQTINFEIKNQVAIQKAKQKIVKHFFIIIASVFAFVLLGMYLKETFNSNFVGYFSVIIGSYLSLKLINDYWFKKIT